MGEPIKKVMIMTATLPITIAPGEGAWTGYDTIEECLDMEKESALDDPETFVGCALDGEEVKVRFEDADVLKIEDVWPDSDAGGLRDNIRSQWPQLADTLDAYTESKAASE
jgi:hypothetical protein